MLENEQGHDLEDANENRDRIWQQWCEACDINGELTFEEVQSLAFREMVDAGESLIHFITVSKAKDGVYRPSPLELIEDDLTVINTEDCFPRAEQRLAEHTAWS